MKHIRHALVTTTLLLVSCSTPRVDPPVTDPNALKPVSAFTHIKNRQERSAAYFTEAGRVLQHPRCLNCHPVDRSPTQGDDLHPHMPPIQATNTGLGVPAFQCTTCHQKDNVSTKLQSISSMPGHAPWMLAPASMAWQGKSLQEICVQVKDTARNGGRSLEQIHEHMAEDALVGWAWHPGEGRTPAPGTQHQLGELLQAWIDTGAACPSS